MTERSRILVATDLTSSADAGLREGAERTNESNGLLAVLHVVRARHSAPRPDELREHVTRIIGDTSAELMVSRGLPHVGIVESARRWRADLIILGAGPQLRAGRFLSGIAERVARRAECSVLVARPPRNHGGVLAATDLSNPSLPAVIAGAAEARRRGTKLEVVHAIGFLGLEARYLLGRPQDVTGASDLIGVARELEAALTRLGIEPRSKVLVGRPARAILQEAVAIDAELVVVGTHRKPGIGGLFRPDTPEQVVRGAPCSVLIVHGQSDSRPAARYGDELAPAPAW